MSRTLSYVVQRVLEKLDLDPVNSINDTPDSSLIAREAEDTFFELASRDFWPNEKGLVSVQSMSDINNPTGLRLQSALEKIEIVRYDTTKSTDTKENIKEIVFLQNEEFLNRMYSLDSSSINTLKGEYKGIPIFVLNNKMPEYYTSFDNEVLIFDSFDKSVETTLNGSKTVVLAYITPVWNSTDTFIIPIDDNIFPIYLAEVASSASLYLNGVRSYTDERRMGRGIARLRRTALKTEKESLKNKFGRNGNGRS